MFERPACVAVCAALRLAREKPAPKAPTPPRGAKVKAILKTYGKHLPDLPIADIRQAIKAETGVDVSDRTLRRFRAGK